MKSFFKISSALILCTAMLSGLGYKRSNNTSVTTAVEIALKVDPNTQMIVPFIFSQTMPRIIQNDSSPRLW